MALGGTRNLKEGCSNTIKVPPSCLSPNDDTYVVNKLSCVQYITQPRLSRNSAATLVHGLRVYHVVPALHGYGIRSIRPNRLARHGTRSMLPCPSPGRQRNVTCHCWCAGADRAIIGQCVQASGDRGTRRRARAALFVVCCAGGPSSISWLARARQSTRPIRHPGWRTLGILLLSLAGGMPGHTRRGVTRVIASARRMRPATRESLGEQDSWGTTI